MTSSLTPEERAGLWVFPDALKVFESLSQIEGPLRVSNWGDHISSLGVPEFLPPVGSIPSSGRQCITRACG